MTGDAAVRGIREIDSSGPVGVFGAEPHPPYNGRPLSKGLWKDQSLEQIWRGTGSLDVELHLSRRAIQLDKSGKLVVDDRGTVYTFDKLLLATGGRPRRLPYDREGDRIIYFRTLDDYRRLRELAGGGGGASHRRRDCRRRIPAHQRPRDLRCRRCVQVSQSGVGQPHPFRALR